MHHFNFLLRLKSNQSDHNQILYEFMSSANSEFTCCKWLKKNFRWGRKGLNEACVLVKKTCLKLRALSHETSGNKKIVIHIDFKLQNLNIFLL